MKKSRFADELIAYAHRQGETGIWVEGFCRKMGISDATYYNWKKKYGGPGVGELRRLKQLEEDNKKLKQLVPDLSLDRQILQDVIRKVLEEKKKRLMVDMIDNTYRIGVRRSCSLVDLMRSVYDYNSSSNRDDTVIKLRMKEIVETRIRYGSPQVFTLLRREGHYINHKRVERIYREQGYSLRNKCP